MQCTATYFLDFVVYITFDIVHIVVRVEIHPFHFISLPLALEHLRRSNKHLYIIVVRVNESVTINK
jgi:hypothetical protein